MQIVPDNWLAGVFGRKVFRVILEDTDGDLKPLDTVFPDHRAPGENGAFYYTKIPTDRVAPVQTLASCGFYVVDVNVTLSCESSSAATPLKTARSFEIRAAIGTDFDQAISIAGSCFRFSRFHLDPAIPVSLANRIKEEWIRSYSRKTRGDELWVALQDGKVVGFLAEIRSAQNNKRIRIIDLIGVDPHFQKRGVGRSLVKFFVNDKSQCDLFQVGTQIANVASLRLYESLGFSATTSQYVLHNT